MVNASLWSLFSLSVCSNALRMTHNSSGAHNSSASDTNEAGKRSHSACWRKVGRHTGLVLAQNPGAGLGDIEPFDRILKDGFLKVNCVKDSMWIHGDKFGGNKHEYKLGSTANVSIVHYNDLVVKEDREKITPTVCFNFCRTIPDMGYFGVINGRECYCEPYFDAMASDSSECDSVCDGDNAQMCGGKTKSSIWEMHMCNDGAQVLAVAAFEAHTVALALKDLVPDVMDAARGKQDLAVEFQEKFGQAGDPDASKLMQSAKVSAGKLLNIAEAADDAMKQITDVIKAAVSLSGLKVHALDVSHDMEKNAGIQNAILDFLDESKVAEFTTFDVAKAGDELVKKLLDLTPKANATLLGLRAAYLLSEPMVNPSFSVRSGSCIADENGCIQNKQEEADLTYDYYSTGDLGPVYVNHDSCVIEVLGELELTVERFHTESGCDTLCLDDGSCYSGQNPELPAKVSGLITWNTDYSILYPGFKICGKQTAKKEGPDAERGIQYYPAMYFVDKEFVDAPMTCSGTVIEEPIYFKSYHGCAAACDARNQECVGFSYFPTEVDKPNLCFLYSSFKTGQYYTGCDSDSDDGKKGPPRKSVPRFLQKSNATVAQYQPLQDEPTHPVCVAKLSKFVGTTLKPNEEGKCKQCFRELTKANRCWE